MVDAEQRNGVGGDEEENASSMLTLNSFDIAKIERSELTPNSESLKFFIVEGLIEREKLREILNDFPPALDSTTKVEAELLGAAPFAALPVLGLVGARGILEHKFDTQDGERPCQTAAPSARGAPRSAAHWRNATSSASSRSRGPTWLPMCTPACPLAIARSARCRCPRTSRAPRR